MMLCVGFALRRFVEWAKSDREEHWASLEKHGLDAIVTGGVEFHGTYEEYKAIQDKWMAQKMAALEAGVPCYYCGKCVNAVEGLCPRCGAPETEGMRVRRPPRPEVRPMGRIMK